MAQGRPYSAYQKASVATSNQKQLIVMLYDGMNKFLSNAIKGIEEEDFEAVHTNSSRTTKILLELLSTLKEEEGGEVAESLKRIYVYAYEQTVIGNLKKDAETLKTVRKVLNNLRAGWHSVYKASQQTSTGVNKSGIRITG